MLLDPSPDGSTSVFNVLFVVNHISLYSSRTNWRLLKSCFSTAASPKSSRASVFEEPSRHNATREQTIREKSLS